jgi:predicted secreted protein
LKWYDGDMKETLRQTRGLGKGRWELTKEDDSQQLSVNVGDKIIVKLLDHSTAGYRWSITQLDTNLITKLEDKYIEPKSKNLGAAGKRKFTLEALNSGTTDVILEEKRQWEAEEKPVSTFKINVLISS